MFLGLLRNLHFGESLSGVEFSNPGIVDAVTSYTIDLFQESELQNSGLRHKIFYNFIAILGEL